MNLYDSEYGSHVKSYKERIIEVINKAVKEHGRTLAIRVDLHDPVILDNGDTISCIANTDSGSIKKVNGYTRIRSAMRGCGNLPRMVSVIFTYFCF